MNEKNVLILTINSVNYGATLQNYALAEKIKLLGFNPISINWLVSYYDNLGIRHDNINNFRNKYINITKPIYTTSELKKIASTGDIIIFGGDQLFRDRAGRKTETEGNMRYYGDFVSGKKVMASYSASFGIDYFESDAASIREFKKLIRRFDRLSVREKSGVDIIKHNFGVESIEVMDPVFLLPMERYCQLIDDAGDLNSYDGDYVGYMNFGDRFGKKLEKNEVFQGKKIVQVMYNERNQLNTVEQWLLNIKNASFVVTNSFHCVAFAIIFRRPFVALPGESRDTRISNILENLNLEGCYRESIELITKEDLQREIDWDKVSILIKERVNNSEKFLEGVLKIRPTYKKPYVNWPIQGIRSRYEKSYLYRKKARDALEYKFGFKQRILRILIKFIVDKKRYRKLKSNHMLFFRDSKSKFIQFLGRFYN